MGIIPASEPTTAKHVINAPVPRMSCSNGSRFSSLNGEYGSADETEKSLQDGVVVLLMLLKNFF
jgi:hypothetical protein